MSEQKYTPDKLRTMASLAYRLAQGNLQVREMGDYLAQCAAAADQHGDLLQQRDHMRAELARLEQATAEADAARIEVKALKQEVSALSRSASAARGLAIAERRQREKLEDEARGNRLWFELAQAVAEECRPLLPKDKAGLIDPIRAAEVARSDRATLAKAMALLIRSRESLTLLASNDADPRAQRLAEAIDALLEQAKCPTPKP